MHFLIVGTDAAGTAAQRQALRPQHVAYWQSFGARLKLGGPLLAEAVPDAAAKASVLLIQAETLAEAQTIADGDPFNPAVFSSITVTPIRLTLGAWLSA